MPDATIRPRLLVVDDDPGILPVVERLARTLGFDVHYYSSGREALDRLGDLHPAVAMVDLQMPELDGLAVLRAVRIADPECQVILITGKPSMDTAIEAVKAGALDYLRKPFDMDRLREQLASVRDGIVQRETLLNADADVASRFEFQRMVGRSPVMLELFSTIHRMAPHGRTFLITGESGTGKELVARALHARGPRRAQRFHILNCSAVVETLFESELFEHAHHGTLFLDEVGELPLALQPKLLRAIEHGEVQRVGSHETRNVDVRVIAATNRDLRGQVLAGRFRSDLFYRLGIIEIRLPPLRDRREDIPYLTAAFVRELAGRLGRPISGVSPAAERLLQKAHWPGNIRELHNVIERAFIMAEGRILSERDVQLALSLPTGDVPRLEPRRPPELKAEPVAGESPDLLTRAERDQIQRVLREAGGNKAAAAKRLGLSRRSLYRWLDRLNLSGQDRTARGRF